MSPFSDYNLDCGIAVLQDDTLGSVRRHGVAVVEKRLAEAIAQQEFIKFLRDAYNPEALASILKLVAAGLAAQKAAEEQLENEQEERS